MTNCKYCGGDLPADRVVFKCIHCGSRLRRSPVFQTICSIIVPGFSQFWFQKRYLMGFGLFASFLLVASIEGSLATLFLFAIVVWSSVDARIFALYNMSLKNYLERRAESFSQGTIAKMSELEDKHEKEIEEEVERRVAQRLSQ